MHWCENCGEYGSSQEKTCSRCGAPLRERKPEEMEREKGDWSIRAEQGPAWPVGEDGNPEKAVRLMDGSDVGCGGDIVASMLRAFGVPVVQQYPGDGQLGKVLLGFSGYGVALFVPESMLALAKELLVSMESTDEEGEQ
ncbi:MAG: hypothetical protein ACOX0U_03440 [Oscillospiraceae bacterium]